MIRTENGPLVTLPYSVELNDIPMMIVQHHESDYLFKRTIDQFDRLYAEGASRAKICSLAIHPYISGQPHRIKYLEQIYDHVARHDGVLHWNGEQILDWYRGIAAQQEGRRMNDPPNAAVGLLPTERIAYSPIADAQAAEAAGRRPHGGVVHRQRRGMGHPLADAAHGADPAGRRRAVARHPELGLARIRQPRRLLAHAQGVRRVQGAGDARDQRLGDRRLSADRRGRERAQLGVHRPRLHPAQHAEGGGRARRHPPHARGDRAGLRQAAARLARPRPHRDLGDAGPAGRGRLRLCRATGCSTTSRCG